MLHLLEAADEAQPTAPPPIDGVTARALHHLLDTLEEAAGFAATSMARIDLMMDRIIHMQSIAEKIGDDPGPVEERETACAKIELFAQQLDVIARKPAFQGVPVLEGGAFRFALGGAFEGLPSELAIDIPNLRVRGKDSLGLFEEIDAMFARIGPGGRVNAAYESDYVEPDETALEEPERHLEGKLEEGEYEVELLYLALDASNVRVTLREKGAKDPLVVVEHISLAPEDDAVEVDLQVGLTLVVDRIARSDEIEIETRTVQTIEWSHEVGERLESVEGWFYETIQPRDFELYAFYLETPLNRLKAVREQLAELEQTVEDLLERVSSRIGLDDEASPAIIRSGLGLAASSWGLIDAEGLLDALLGS